MKLKRGIHRIQSINQVIYALDCGGKYALVDVGDAGEWETKRELLAADGITPDQIGAVLITHFHGDHCGALAKVRAEAKAKVITHELSIQRATQERPIKKELVDETVGDGDTIQLGKVSLTVHHLPGHTHDSVVYQMGHDLFVGDITFEWAGIGWMDIHWGSCVPQYRDSLNRLREMRPATLFPGHGGPCALSDDSIYRALNTLDILSKIDGSPLMIGRPAAMRSADAPRRTVRVKM